MVYENAAVLEKLLVEKEATVLCVIDQCLARISWYICFGSAMLCPVKPTNSCLSLIFQISCSSLEFLLSTWKIPIFLSEPHLVYGMILYSFSFPSLVKVEIRYRSLSQDMPGVLSSKIFPYCAILMLGL